MHLENQTKIHVIALNCNRDVYLFTDTSVNT